MVLTACDFGDPSAGRELGLSLAPSGQILVAVNPCTEWQVEGVRLLDLKGRIFGDADDTVIWEIKASPPSRMRVLTIGEIPTGFVVVVNSMPESLLDLDLGVEVFTDLYAESAYTDFRIGELKAGQVRDYRRRYLALEKFQQLDTCKL